MQYALIRDFRVENIIEADETFSSMIAREWDAVAPLEEGAAVAIGWGWQAGEGAAPGSFIAPEPVPAPEPETDKLSKTAFRKLFTGPEKVGIELAALHDPTKPINDPANVLAAAIRVSQADQRDADYIDRKDPLTRAGVQALEAGGCLAAGRALQILDGPPIAQQGDAQ